MRIDGSLTRAEVRATALELDALLAGEGPVTLDLSSVTALDSAGVALLSVFFKKLKAQGRALEVGAVSPEVQRMLALFPLTGPSATLPVDPTGRIERLGERSGAIAELLFEYLRLLADTAWFSVVGLFSPKQMRWPVVFYEMSSMGARAFGVVGLIAFLVGATMALQSAVQLRQFGANIFVVDLIAISMTRELGPLMAAIAVAGRSGSAVAAEIGTMVITEEVDALRTMGLHPTRFLVVPKFVAICFTQPILTMYANLLGLFGGFLVATTYLDIGPTTFVQRLDQALFLKDLLTGLFKSVLFAGLIVTIGALAGFRTRGGADAVGRSTTASVVAGIFAVIAADAAASLVFYF